MGNPGAFIKRAFVAAGLTLVFLLAIWLPLLGYVHYVALKKWNGHAAAWVTGEERRELMRYHGTNSLKITQDRVFIWRDSRWVPVRKRIEG
jgi:hypothetical protein